MLKNVNIFKNLKVSLLIILVNSMIVDLFFDEGMVKIVVN